MSWSRLVDRVRAGDPAGMEQLYAVFVKGVRFFLWQQLGPQDLDDKVHDVFLIITQSIQRGELRDPDQLMGYVRAVVRRQVAAHIDNAGHLRRTQQSIDPAMTLSDHQPDPERRVIEQESQDVALRTLSALPERDREVLVRFYLQEQKAEEICRDLDLTQTQFRLIRSRAKARLGELGRRRFSSRSRTGPAKETQDNSAGSWSTSAWKLSNKVAQEPAGVNQGGHTDIAVLAHAHETFGSQEKADHWLRRPNHVFQGRTPLEVVGSDPQAVEIELTRIDYGVYI
jgi:RNA polymerase sigma-70 factor, ECF subfamily